MTHPLYQTWWNMLQRCYNPDIEAYQYYGARGITVCKRWRNSLQAFIDDMGPRPSGMTLDRRNNDRGYTPSNCRWATAKEQARNRRKGGGRAPTLYVEYKNRKVSFSELAVITGLNEKLLYGRIKSLGWTIEKAITYKISGLSRK